MAILHSVSYGTSDNTLVFIGSLGSTTDMWLPQLDALHKDFRVIAVDHRGHGLSELIEGTPTVADLAQDVLDTLDDLGVGNFGVIGLSLGGAVAQYLAATSDRVTKAAFMCTAAKFGEPQGWLDRAAACRENGTGSLSEAVIQRWFSPLGWRTTQRPASTSKPWLPAPHLRVTRCAARRWQPGISPIAWEKSPCQCSPSQVPMTPPLLQQPCRSLPMALAASPAQRS